VPTGTTVKPNGLFCLLAMAATMRVAAIPNDIDMPISSRIRCCSARMSATAAAASA